MTTEADEFTPNERLVRVSDWNELRRDVQGLQGTVQGIADRQLEMLEIVSGFTLLHDRVTQMERRLWAPTIAATFVLLLTVIVRLWP